MAGESVIVRAADIEQLSDGSVAVRSQALVNSLIREPSTALELLGSLGVTDVSQIYIDAVGRVVLAGARVPEMEAAAGGKILAKNIICGLSC